MGGGCILVDPHFLTSTLPGSEWTVSRPGRFTHVERDTGTHWIGGWVDPRAGMDDVEKRKIFDHTRTRTPTHRSSSPLPVAIPSTLSRIMLIYVNSYDQQDNITDWQDIKQYEGVIATSGMTSLPSFMKISPFSPSRCKGAWMSFLWNETNKKGRSFHKRDIEN
jgi:hypothetical protein